MKNHLSVLLLITSFMGVAEACAADMPNIGTCENEKIVNMKCTVESADSNFLKCESRIVFCQQGSSTHIYGRELRICPSIVDNLSLEVKLLQASSFKFEGITFNSEVNTDQTQITAQIVRPDNETMPVHIEGFIKIGGKIKYPKPSYDCVTN
jgi:hypothetical protein